MSRKVIVLSTGGTIASRRDGGGGSVARDGADALVGGLPRPADVTVEAIDVMRLGSYLLTFQDMLRIVHRIHLAFAGPDVAGVVVTHGTDTMEETAYLADLVHADARPVVFTGAQRAADAPEPDGPANLTDAITVAASPAARDLGAVIVFAGHIFPARGTRKSFTLAKPAFTNPDHGALGRVVGSTTLIEAAPPRPPPLELAPLDLSEVRVDLVPYYPGADTIAMEAAARAGAQGLVLEGIGAGNANPAFCRGVERLTAAGVVVALSTRVAAGPVAALYGAGGGFDLINAGAIPTGTLRSAQSRVLMAALIGSARNSDHVQREFRRRTAP